jgi:hypothetical protein
VERGKEGLGGDDTQRRKEGGMYEGRDSQLP